MKYWKRARFTENVAEALCRLLSHSDAEAGHGYPSSGGSGWGSEQKGLVHAWWRLTEVSVRAAALATEAIAPAVNSQGSVRAAATTDWKVQGAMVQTEMTVAVARARSWCAQLRQ